MLTFDNMLKFFGLIVAVLTLSSVFRLSEKIEDIGGN